MTCDSFTCSLTKVTFEYTPKDILIKNLIFNRSTANTLKTIRIHLLPEIKNLCIYLCYVYY